MSKRARRPAKPFDPNKGRADNFEAVGLSRDAAKLQQHDDVHVTRAGHARDGKKVEDDSARRLDAFEALKDSMRLDPFAGCYDAARRLERDTRISLGQHDRGAPFDRVDNSNDRDRMDRMIAASERLVFVRGKLSPLAWKLLAELIEPTFADPTWRDTVSRVMRERNPNAQGATVRAACVYLREAYDALDVVRQRAA